MRTLALELFGILAIGFASLAHAQAIDLGKAKAAYEDQCSKCHGLIEREAKGQAPRQRTLYTETLIASSDMRFVMAPPYGPPLRGVYGRPAGSMTNFGYSQAFKRELQGVVWDQPALEKWITDSQNWVPGARMFYRQPDPEIRRQIIAYLKTHSP